MTERAEILPLELLVLGLMSGSSLDGLDVAACRFRLEPSGALPRVSEWALVAGSTYPYDSAWQEVLGRLPALDAGELALVHVRLADWWAERVASFLHENQLRPALIASHGHTALHWPEKRVTLQIGDGATLATRTGLPVVCDFRTADVAQGGVGTPLAPLADWLLFGDYPYCLNIGGIANISYTGGVQPVAFDVGPANQILNFLASVAGKPFDEDGKLAAQGRLQSDLLKQVHALPFFDAPFPKSLDNGWIQQEVRPIYARYEASAMDKLHTACVQLAQQVAQSIRLIHGGDPPPQPTRKMLVTGGGAFNPFLVEKIREAIRPLGVEVVLPPAAIIDFKEAILMGLMGALRWLEYPNCLASVTGATSDSVGGAVYLPSVKKG